MKGWEKLYSVLKLTRGDDQNLPLDQKHQDRIQVEIKISEIEKMSKSELQEAVISYIKAVVPGIRKN